MNMASTRDHSTRNLHRSQHNTSLSPSTPMQASSISSISEGSLLLLQRVSSEKEHDKYTNKTKSSLLSEGLANVSPSKHFRFCAKSLFYFEYNISKLRMLTKEIQEDDWKYNDTSGGNDYHGMKYNI